MNDLDNKFYVGDIVTFRSHPLFDQLRIKGDSRYVPPIMIVNEVHFETKQKKIADESTGKIIAERIKYICTYFDDNKGEFIDVHLYEGMLRTFDDLKFERINNDGKNIGDYTSLKEEVKSYSIPNYEYGKIINFKTKKLEIYKKRTSKKITVNESGNIGSIKESLQYVVNYATPEFVICGFKIEHHTDLFYGDGKKKRLASKKFFKVKWFNPFQQKFSEQYLPEEFFTDDDIFELEKINSEKTKPVNPSINQGNIKDFDPGKN
jgi:hypothetical protein